MRADTELEFHGFGAEEQAKAKRLSAECIIIDSDPEEDAIAEEPTGLEARDQLSEPEDEAEMGLFGRQLYVCGNLACDETAETPAELKARCFLLLSDVLPCNNFLFLIDLLNAGASDGVRFSPRFTSADLQTLWQEREERRQSDRPPTTARS